ncbi:MAG: MBL fold metallo-hydrolase [Thermoplasmata archaeon]|nr:MBL fold metallo-hydrolase [Thermoplasmata archaeon]
MIKLTFLGTGGGRFATLYQTRATGGVYLEDFTPEKPFRVHIDPGPGALVHAGRNGINPTQTDGIIVTHCHPDHYVDAEILTEAMTMGGRRKKGFLLGSRSTLEGVENIGPCISRYFQKNVETCMIIEKTSMKLGELVVTPAPAIHSDPTTVGLRISTNTGIIAYVADTEFSKEIAGAYRNARVLILPVTRPRAAKIPYHLTTDDAAEFAAIVKPELCIITHFGLKMLEADPEAEARWIEQQSKVKCIAASDGMKIEVD